MIKQLFIYWDQGFRNAPNIVQKCLLTWKKHNPTWHIIELDDSNLSQYIDLKQELPENISITKASMSDVIRICLLEKYGGLWVDATTYCVKPLDDWILQYITSGFFAFSNNVPEQHTLISSWFLYGDKDNYIVKKQKQSVIDYIHKSKVGIGLLNPSSSAQYIDDWFHNKYEKEFYFWFHMLFTDSYHSDNVFKSIWDNTPKYSSDTPHTVQLGIGMLTEMNDNIQKRITDTEAPLHKLTYRYDENEFKKGCVLDYLFEQINQENTQRYAKSLQPAKIINNTLVFFANLLHLHNIDNWFISYGTLLGIVRNNSCIEGDDDIDIIIDIKHYQKIMQILAINEFYTYDVSKLDKFNQQFIKTVDNDKLCSVDFYFAEVDDNGDFNDTWNELIWSNCFTNNNDKQFILYDWNGTVLHIPNNYETKLIKLYGENWQTPLSRDEYVTVKTRNINIL
jgi:hypothetical protein